MKWEKEDKSIIYKQKCKCEEIIMEYRGKITKIFPLQERTWGGVGKYGGVTSRGGEVDNSSILCRRSTKRRELGDGILWQLAGFNWLALGPHLSSIHITLLHGVICRYLAR